MMIQNQCGWEWSGISLQKKSVHVGMTKDLLLIKLYSKL